MRSNGRAFQPRTSNMAASAVFNSSFLLFFPSANLRALMPSPEELACEKTDPLLQQCGWMLQNRSTINLSTSRGVAICEALLKDRDEVDHLLFVGKAIGTVEAKSQGIPLLASKNINRLFAS